MSGSHRPTGSGISVSWLWLSGGTDRNQRGLQSHTKGATWGWALGKRGSAQAFCDACPWHPCFLTRKPAQLD